MTTKDSLSVVMLAMVETEKTLNEEQQQRELLSLGNLPDVVLKHLAPFLDWSSCRSLSQVNHRFRSHFVSLLRQGRSLSIKGQMSVGVGDRECGQNVSYLYEFYTVHVEMDNEMQVYWTLKLESGVRTIVQKKYNGASCTETSRSVHIPSREYLEQLLKWILERYQFKKIHLGISGLAPLLAKYLTQVSDFGVSDEVEYLKLAEKLSPKKLAVFQPSQNHHKRGELNLKKFPKLEELCMYGVPLDVDQLVESKLLKVTADTITKNIKVKHIEKIIDNWKNGRLNYKKIKISSEPARLPIRVPYQKWSMLHDERDETDSFYDDILNSQQKIGSFRYSPKSFEFVSWEYNGGIEPARW